MDVISGAASEVVISLCCCRTHLTFIKSSVVPNPEQLTQKKKKLQRLHCTEYGTNSEFVPVDLESSCCVPAAAAFYSFFFLFVNYSGLGTTEDFIKVKCVLQQSEITTSDAGTGYNIHHMDGLLSWELSPDKGSPIIQPGTPRTKIHFVTKQTNLS